jgi:hypothetical protein
LDLLLDAPRAQAYFGVGLPFVATTHGARVPLYRDALMSSQPNTQAHAGQLLAALAEQGVPLDRAIQFGGNARGTVADLLTDLLANFTLHGEISWDVVAIAVYIPPSRSWKNKWGEQFTFDHIVKELSSREPAEAACAGIHDEIALTVVLKVDQAVGILSPGARSALHERLANRVSTSAKTQREDGSWGLQWYEEPDVFEARELSPPESEVAILVTGHLLEWLMLLPHELQPDDDSIYSRAGEWLLAALNLQTQRPEWIRERYCPLIHAARALKFLGGG